MAEYTLHLGDCLEYMRGMEAGSVDAVVTDPPYPDFDVERFRYKDELLEPLGALDCPQLIFWSARADFPLSYSAIHIWYKHGIASPYERIFERNGQSAFLVFSKMSIDNAVRAMRSRDVFTLHPSQKPVQLIRMLVERASNPGDTVFDPFMGSGTTGVACMQLGRNFIGCEIDPGYHAIAEKRIREAAMQPPLFVAEAGPKAEQLRMGETP